MSCGLKVWLVGAGGMAADYTKVLQALRVSTTVIGRGVRSAKIFQEGTGVPVVLGGLETFLASSPAIPDCAIVAVGVEGLAEATRRLLVYGVQRILVEKPGALYREDIAALALLAAQKTAHVLIAYNRRLYASCLRAQQIIAEDGGVRSMHFEFTEWSHVIGALEKADGVKQAWLLANSTHVIDLAFYLAGRPVEWSAYTIGGLEWHPISAIFSGAGRTDRNVLFSYQADWDGPGRWGVEIITARSRLIFRPIERLQVIHKGSVVVEEVPLDDDNDHEFKPGLYEQVRRFVLGEFDGLCSVEEQVCNWDVYTRIAGYAT